MEHDRVDWHVPMPGLALTSTAVSRTVVAAVVALASVPCGAFLPTPTTVPIPTPPGTRCQRYESSDVPRAIPDVASITSSLVVTGGGTIADVTVELEGQHPYMHDLTFHLTSPTGTVVLLIGTKCSSDDGFYLRLNDAMATLSCPPFGTYAPEEALAAFDGERTDGTWTLIARDALSGDTGTLTAWSLEICSPLPVVPSPTASPRTPTAVATAPATATPAAGTPPATRTATRSATVPASRTPTGRPAAAPPAPCVGDCDRSRVVRADELIAGVNIALGVPALDNCPSFDGDGNARVTVDELVRAVRNALNGCPKLDVVLQILPGAVLLDRDRNAATLKVQAFDRQGNEFPLDTVAIEWLSNDAQVARVVPDSSDATIAAVTVLPSIGTAMVTARLAADPEVVAPLVAVTRAKLHPEVDLVPDEDVVFPPPNLPNGVPVSPDRIPDLTPAGPGGEARFGGFSESELAERLEVTDTFAVRYPIVLRGSPPAPGQRLLASGGAAVAGVVEFTQQRGGFTLVQLAVVAPQELFESLDFSVSAEQLLADGLLMPFDTSGWETDDSNGSGASEEAGAGLGAQVEIPVGPFACKPVGLGILPTFLQTPTGSHTYFGPIWDGAMRIGFFKLEYFYFKAGLQARALFNPEIRLSQGVRIEAVCDLKDEHRINRKLPVSGPMAVILAPYVEGLVSIPFKVGVSGGSTSRYGMKLGFDYALWTGGTYTPEAGWQPLCEAWSDCSRTNQEAELIWEEDRSGNQLTIEGESGLFLAGDAGVQAGGIIFDVLGKIPGMGTILSGATKALEQKGKVPILRARLGPQGTARWHNASRTAFIEASEGAANLVVQGDLNVRFDALNSYLQTALRLTGVRSLPLLTFPLFHFGEPYRTLNEETLTINGKRLSTGPSAQPVEVRRGDTVSVVSTVERDFINLTLIELFLTSVSLHQDFPHAGAIWVNGTSVADMTATNEFTLSGSFPATAALCDQAAAGEGTVEVKLLAFNRMFSVIPTANFVGSFALSCADATFTPTRTATATRTATRTHPTATATRTSVPSPPPVPTATHTPSATATPVASAGVWRRVESTFRTPEHPSYVKVTVSGNTATYQASVVSFDPEHPDHWTLEWTWTDPPATVDPGTREKIHVEAEVTARGTGGIERWVGIVQQPCGNCADRTEVHLSPFVLTNSADLTFEIPAGTSSQSEARVFVYLNVNAVLDNTVATYVYRWSP